MTPQPSPSVQQRTAQLFQSYMTASHVRTDRLFVWLLPIQWLAGIATAFGMSPRTWEGPQSTIHLHIWIALLLGGLIISLPVSLALTKPGAAITRHSIAVAQMLMGALLIHLSGGRIETHFHVFGSLAFLAFYRDWTVLLTASVTVACDHFIRGIYYPLSVFGVLYASPWRWLEHAGWVVFEDCFLIIACRRSVQEMRLISGRQAELEVAKAEIEQTVDARTAELRTRTVELHEQRRRVKEIIATARVAFIGMDENGSIIDWNRQAERTFGWSKSEARGRSFAELVLAPEAREIYNDDLRESLGNRESAHFDQRFEFIAIHRDGRRFPVELSRWPVLQKHGVHWNAVIQDISKRKQAETVLRRAKEAAEVANRSKSEFLANMSHEIRTPMNGIVGMTRLALGTSLTPTQREYLDMVARSADSLLTIINDVLDFSKVEAGKLTLDPNPFSIRECVEGLLQDMSIRAHGKGLELAYHLAPEVPATLIGDRGRLRQILINLIGNALKFTPAGEVSLHIRLLHRTQKQARLEFAVRDTGIGIGPDKLNAIFQPFEQGDNSTSRRFGGTGLGLAISRKLVTLMGGKISVQSQLGQGSEFVFDALFDWAEESAARRFQPLPVLNSLPVLIVDDNATNRRLLQDLFFSWRMRPLLADGGRQAMEALKNAARAGQPFELVVLDAVMPEMDGFDVAAAIQRHPEYAKATVMMLSSADRTDDAERCRVLGIDAFLTKPVTQPGLFDAMVKAMQIRLEKPGGSKAGRESLTRPDLPLAERRLRILLAEDNAINQKLAIKLLDMLGHQVVTANNGIEALTAVSKQCFDLVLMDVQMPDMDGLEATKALRRIEAGQSRRLPVIAMTAHALIGDRERCLAAGMDGYVPKPIEPEELRREIARVVGIDSVSRDGLPPQPSGAGQFGQGVASS